MSQPAPTMAPPAFASTGEPLGGGVGSAPVPDDPAHPPPDNEPQPRIRGTLHLSDCFNQRASKAPT